MKAWGTTEAWAGNRARAALVKKFFVANTAGSGVNGFFSDASDLTTAIAIAPKDARALFDKKSVNVNLSISTPTIFAQGYQVIKFTNVRADGGATHDTKYVDMDIPFMRAGEAYLTYAEAVTRLSTAQVGSYTALQAVNALRARAGATQFTSLTLPNIIDEWSREFFFEGRRRMDLIRFNMYGGPTGYTWDWKSNVAVGKDFPVEYNIFPLPASDLNANSNLVQNPGYGS